jgi:peroxiredoxin
MGSPAAAGEFCRERAVPFSCYADPDRSAYRAFALSIAGPARWASPRVLARGARLFRKGIAAGLPHPGQDIRQMPGTFVIARGGTIRLAYYNTDASDNPPVEKILGALGAA